MQQHHLPPTVQQAGLLFQNTIFRDDPEATRQIVAWGYAQIDQEYPEDPIRSPLNLLRRQWARIEWERVVRTSGRELRGAIAAASVRELEFQLQRRHEEILAADQERRRRDATTFNSNQQVADYRQIADIDQEREVARLQEAHRLAQEAEEAASQRRMAERAHETDQELATLILGAMVRAMGASSAEQTLAATRLVNQEITRIRRDPELTPDEQHFQIRTLLETMPQMLRGMRPADV